MMKQEEFEARKKVLMDRATQKGAAIRQLAGADRDFREVCAMGDLVSLSFDGWSVCCNAICMQTLSTRCCKRWPTEKTSSETAS